MHMNISSANGHFVQGVGVGVGVGVGGLNEVIVSPQGNY